MFETILVQFCESHDLTYLEFRLWIGVWVAIILVLLVALDASAFVCYITRFTEENFATLIALIFMVEVSTQLFCPACLSLVFRNVLYILSFMLISLSQAVKNVAEIGKKYPLNKHSDTYDGSWCECRQNESYPDSGNISWTEVKFTECTKDVSTPRGLDSCGSCTF